MDNQILVETSARHVHLTDEHIEILFGKGHTLTHKKDLSQPGQFACEERVTLVGPKKQIPNVIILGPARPATQVEVSFTDVEEGAYYYDAMLWAVKNGITKGTTETTFSPFETVTRAQVVTFLYRAENTPDVSDVEVSFTDVNEGAFYYDAMLWAVKNGITNGTTETTFSPNDGCSRGQIVTFLYRCLAEA